MRRDGRSCPRAVCFRGLRGRYGHARARGAAAGHGRGDCPGLACLVALLVCLSELQSSSQASSPACSGRGFFRSCFHSHPPCLGNSLKSRPRLEQGDRIDEDPFSSEGGNSSSEEFRKNFRDFWDRLVGNRLPTVASAAPRPAWAARPFHSLVAPWLRLKVVLFSPHLPHLTRPLPVRPGPRGCGRGYPVRVLGLCETPDRLSRHLLNASWPLAFHPNAKPPLTSPSLSARLQPSAPSQSALPPTTPITPTSRPSPDSDLSFLPSLPQNGPAPLPLLRRRLRPPVRILTHPPGARSEGRARHSAAAAGRRGQGAGPGPQGQGGGPRQDCGARGRRSGGPR